MNIFEILVLSAGLAVSATGIVAAVRSFRRLKMLERR